jgi:hypothetical protein
LLSARESNYRGAFWNGEVKFIEGLESMGAIGEGDKEVFNLEAKGIDKTFIRGDTHRDLPNGLGNGA